MTSGPEQGLIRRGGEIPARLPTTRDSGSLLPMTLWPHDDAFPPPVRTQASACPTMRPSEQSPGGSWSVQIVSRGLSSGKPSTHRYDSPVKTSNSPKVVPSCRDLPHHVSRCIDLVGSAPNMRKCTLDNPIEPENSSLCLDRQRRRSLLVMAEAVREHSPAWNTLCNGVHRRCSRRLCV